MQMLASLQLHVLSWLFLPIIASGIQCALTAFQDVAEPDCAAPQATHHFDFVNRDEAVAVATFQPGTPNVRIRLEATGSLVHLKLVDFFAQDCIIGPYCKNANGCNGTDPCINYRETQWYYSGQVADGPTVIQSSGVLYRPMQIVLVSDGAATNITLHYSFDALPDCNQRTPECYHCTVFAGCGDHDIPACTGSHRASCIRMTEVVISATDEGSEPVDCQCCHLPFNPVPVEFGAALDLDMVTSRHFTVRRSYILFFEWLNAERGGICVGGERRFARLTLYGGHNVNEISYLTQSLIRNRNITLLLSPYSSVLTEPAADIANQLGAVMVAGGASSTSVFAGRNQVFGILPPGDDIFSPTSEVLSSKDPGVVVGVLTAPAYGSCDAPAAISRSPTLVMGEVVTISDTPTDEEILNGLSMVFRQAPEAALVTCILSTELCNRVISGIARGGFRPRAVIMNTCMISGEFDIDNGRFAMGTTPWLAGTRLQSLPPAVDYNMGSTDGRRSGSALDSQYWASRFSARFGPAGEPLVVPYQAASSWTACVALVTAVETGNSTTPRAVADQLHMMRLPTIYGVVDFDENGQSRGLYALVQYQGVDNEPRLVAPLLVARDEVFYPMPTALDRKCFLAAPPDSVFGIHDTGNADSDCVRCTGLEFAMKSVWNASQRRRNCQACPQGEAPLVSTRTSPPTAKCVTACPAGRSPRYGPTGNFIECTVCESGTRSTLLTCDDCAPGTFSSSPGRSSCSACPAGTFTALARSTACEVCPAGTASEQERSHTCHTCTKGTYAGTNGSDACRLCDAGTVSDEIMSTSCETCLAGSYSRWGSRKCDFCEVGRFQSLDRQSTCIFGSGLGARFNDKGLTTGINNAGFWTSDRPGKGGVKWEPCLQNPGACLENMMCQEGATGRQCGSCIPGYGHIRHRGLGACFACPPPAVNLSMTILVVLFTVVMVFWLARTAVWSTKFPKDIRFMLVKILILYFVMGDVSTALLVDICQTFLNRRASNLEDTPAILARVVSWASAPLKIFPAGTVEAESWVWSVSCLLQPHEPDLADALRFARHTDFYDPAYAKHWAALKEYQLTTELRVALFWIAWPLLIFFIVYVLSILYVWTHLTTRREYYLQALEFYADLCTTGLRRARSSRTQVAWVGYTRTYNSKIAGLWWPVVQAEALFKGGHRSTVGRSLWTLDWRAFHHEGLPLVHAVLIICQGGALQNTMRPYMCGLFGEDMLQKMANMLPCREGSILTQLVAFLSMGVWGVLAPFLLFRHVRYYRFHPRYHDHEELLCVVTRGYALYAWFWESALLLVKFLILVIFHFFDDVDTKNGAFLVLGMAYGLGTMAFEPFQRFHNGLCKRLNAYFMLLWVATSLTAAILHLLVQHEFMNPWPVALASLLVSFCHIAFIIRLIFSFYMQALGAYMESVDVRTWCKPLEEPRNRNLRIRLRRWLLKQYTQGLAGTPYVGLYSDFDWVSVFCNRSDQEVLPSLPIKTGKLPDLSQAPASPEHPIVKRCGAEQRREFHFAVESALKNIVEILGTPVISVSLLEFTVRAGFVFAVQHEKQQRKLCGFSKKAEADHGRRTTVFSKLRDTAEALHAADPTQILATQSEHPSDGEIPRKRDFWKVAKQGLQRLRKAAKEVEEEEMEQRLLVEQVHAREVERKQGAMSVIGGKTQAAAHLDKMNSAAYNSAMLREAKFYKAFRLLRMLGIRRNSGTQKKHAVLPKSESATLGELQGHTGVSPDVYINLRRRVEQMFWAGNFARGVNINSFELGLLEILKIPPHELVCLIDKFEERWIKEMKHQWKRIGRLAGFVKDENIQIDLPATQTSAESDQKEPDQQEPEQRKSNLSSGETDDYTVASLPKLGILTSEEPTLHRHNVTLGQRAADACSSVDASTQVNEDDLDGTQGGLPTVEKKRVPIRMPERTKAAVLSWVHFSMLIIMPDVKAVRRVQRCAGTRSLSLEDLQKHVEGARVTLEATRARRQALESQEEVQVNKAVPLITPRKRVLPPVGKGLYED